MMTLATFMLVFDVDSSS